MQLERPLPPLPKLPGMGTSKKAKQRRAKREKELIAESKLPPVAPTRRQRPRMKPAAQPILYKRPMTKTKVIGTGVAVDPLRASFKRRADDKHCSCEGTDFLGYVMAPPASELTLGQALYAQSLNPSLWQGSRVANEAKLWERFRFRDVVIVFQSENGTNQKGQLLAYVDPDPVAQVAEDVAAAWPRENRVTFNAWETAYMPYPTDPEFTDLFVGPQGEDPRLSSAGNVYVLYNGGFINTAEEAVYTVAVQYKIDFWNAKSKSESDDPITEIVNGSMDLGATRRRRLTVPGDALFQGATKILDTLGVTIASDGKITIPVTNIGQNKLFIGIDLNTNAGDSVTRGFEVQDNMTGATLDEASTGELVVSGGSEGNLFSWSGLASAVASAGQVVIDAALSEIGSEIITEGASLLLTLLPALLAKSARKSELGTFPYLLRQREFVRRLTPRHLSALNVKYSRIPRFKLSADEAANSGVHSSYISTVFASNLTDPVSVEGYSQKINAGFDVTYTGTGDNTMNFTLARQMRSDEFIYLFMSCRVTCTVAADLTTFGFTPITNIPSINYFIGDFPDLVFVTPFPRSVQYSQLMVIHDLPPGPYNLGFTVWAGEDADQPASASCDGLYTVWISISDVPDEAVLEGVRKQRRQLVRKRL